MSTTSLSRAIAASRIRSGGTGWTTTRRVLATGGYCVVGAVGLFAFVLVLLPLLGWHTVVLASGSMTPTWPAGSVLVSREVAATDVAVGDVVTVVRSGQLPVTHRVVAVAGAVGTVATRELTLQGDANSAPDPRPYTVDSVGLVLGGLPWGGQFIVALRSPWVMGAITLIVALLVLRAWWPRSGGGRRAKAH